ncbi:hypothetical protein [Robertmurraya andreesenii]|uniref:Uncharacterized protein n=1 Tax=Anoxybacillus andreesenii TaxID=1325932 RepID=A0ABT9UZM7_9BACL|nr:hypothetical protein [Robertmurraya andreesenii]MDQ0154149.1 hypothetical protein [Robertmurraya andreesenii]
MPQESFFGQFTLDEEAAKKLISSPRTKIRHTNVPNDLKLSKSERIINAERVLNSRKGK